MIKTIAGYRFVELDELRSKKQSFLAVCAQWQLKGTILLSLEGININLAGMSEPIAEFLHWLEQEEVFSRMRFHEGNASEMPYQRLKVKIKKEIITFHQSSVKATKRRAPAVSPVELKRWLDESREVTLLDTRNDYEVAMGTFKGAVDLELKHFDELASRAETLDREKTIVMFCTGGIRCEKAAIYLQDQGFKDVYQLDGGILGYFKEVGGAHYQGDCFVFDERVVVSPN